MSIATEINKLRDRQESIIQEINNKGVSLPSGSSLAACATAISQIQTGGGGTSFTGHVDRVGLAAIGWTEDDIDFYQEHGVNWNEEQDNLHLVSDYNKSLYANATKTTYEGVEMAASSYFDTFKNDKRCRFLPKVDTHALTSVSFLGCGHINVIPKLNVSVTSMSSMFNNCYSLTSLDLSGFDTSKVTSMQNMFNGCYSLMYVDLSGFDTSSVTSMQNMFNGCYSLTSFDLSSFDTSKVTNMQSMFNGCFSLTYVDLSGFDTSSVTSMQNMFNYCYSLTSLDLSGFDTSKVTSMQNMLYDCYSLASLDLSGFDTSSVTSMSSMFNNCSALSSVDLSSFDTSKVTNMQNMFNGCYSLMYVDLSGFDTSSVTDMQSMFNGCYPLASLDLSGFDTSKVTNMQNMLSGCYSLASLDLGDSFKYDSISATSGNPFNNNSVSIIWCGDYNSVKSVLSSFSRTTTSLAFSIKFASNSKVKDDSNGTLAALKAACEAKGFTVSNLTIEAAA